VNEVNTIPASQPSDVPENVGSLGRVAEAADRRLIELAIERRRGPAQTEDADLIYFWSMHFNRRHGLAFRVLQAGAAGRSNVVILSARPIFRPLRPSHRADQRDGGRGRCRCNGLATPGSGRVVGD